jgi:hypothetical protein
MKGDRPMKGKAILLLLVLLLATLALAQTSAPPPGQPEHRMEMEHRTGPMPATGLPMGMGMDMGKFMGHNAFKFFISKRSHNPCRSSYCRMLGIPSRRKSIRNISVHNIDFRHWHSRSLRQIRNHSNQIRCLLGINFTCTIHIQHNFITIPIASKIHKQGYDKHDSHTSISTKEFTYCKQ